MTTVAVVGSTWTFPIGLYSQADTKLLITNPTIAAGDFTLTINGVSFGNLDNLPTVNPAGGTDVEIVLSVAETTAAGAGGRISITWEDVAAAQWCSGKAIVFVHAAEMDHLDIAVEGTYTMRQLLRIMSAALAGKVSGGGTTTVTFRDLGDTTNRIVATVTNKGNRTAVVLDAT